jgi:hypothetical protein
VNDWYDPFGNARVNYGNSNNNVPNRFVAYALYNLPNLHTTIWAKYLANDWSINDSFQMQNGLPFTAGVTGYTSNALVSGWNGSGGSSVIPEIGRNTMKYPRKIVDDMRLQKEVPFGERLHLQLMLNVFNCCQPPERRWFFDHQCLLIVGIYGDLSRAAGNANSISASRCRIAPTTAASSTRRGKLKSPLALASKTGQRSPCGGFGRRIFPGSRNLL